MPEPAFVMPVTPYKPPPSLIPASTEDPNKLWEKVLPPEHFSNLKFSKDHRANGKWWLQVTVKPSPRPNPQSNNDEPTIIEVPVVDPNDIVPVGVHSKIVPAIFPVPVDDALTSTEDLLSESSEVQDTRASTETGETTTLDPNSVPIDEHKEIDMTNVMSVETSTQRGNWTRGEENETAEATVDEEETPVEQHSTESDTTEAASSSESPSEGVSTDRIATAPSTSVTTTATEKDPQQPESEQVVELENVTNDSSTPPSTEKPTIELKTTTPRSQGPKRPKFERPLNAHEEIVTQHSKIPDSFIQTMPPNSVILVIPVENPNGKEQIMNAIKASANSGKGGNLESLPPPPRERPSEDVTNTTERLDVPTTVPQISNDTDSSSPSDLLNVTPSVTDAVTEQMITETTTIADDSSTTDTRPTVTPSVVVANNAAPVLDTFQGSVIDTGSTESSKDAIEVSESSTRVRIVNQEDVIVERIPPSLRVEEKSKEREDFMHSDSSITSVMDIIKKSDARRKASDAVVTQARTRKLSSAGNSSESKQSILG